MSTDGHDARLDAVPRFIDSGRSTHGVDCTRRTLDEQDQDMRAQWELSDEQLRALESNDR